MTHSMNYLYLIKLVKLGVRYYIRGELRYDQSHIL